MEKVPQSIMVKEKKIRQVEKEDPDNKSTKCYLCSAQCHENCQLDEVYKKGAYQIKDCIIFEEDENSCAVCSHESEVHGHEAQIIKVDEEYEEEVQKTVYVDSLEKKSEARI
jgi:hypothetical protein